MTFRNVGCVHVDRSGAVKLTPIGKVFLEDARRVSFAWEQALSNVDRMRRETPMNLAVLTFRDYKPISDQIRLAVRNLRKDYPLLEVVVRYADQVDYVSDLREGRADICFSPFFDDDDARGIVQKRFLHMPLVAVVHKEHPFASRDAISASDLAGELVHTVGSGKYRDVYRHTGDMMAQRADGIRFVEHTWDTVEKVFEFGFANGVFVSEATSVFAFSILPSLDDYAVVPFSDDGMFIEGGCAYLEGNGNNACRIFSDEMARVVAGKDMAPYWG